MSLYEVRRNRAVLLKSKYFIRDTPYKGPTVQSRKHKDGHIIKYIDLISK